jgi:hypothetical protein
MTATQDHATNSLHYRQRILNESLINSRNIWGKYCSERGTKHVTIVGYMPGCQESRQPGSIIFLDRYITKYEMKINSVPCYKQTKESGTQYEKYNIYWDPVWLTECKVLTF